MALSKEISQPAILEMFIKGCKLGFNHSQGHHYGFTKEELNHLIGEVLFICGLDRNNAPEPHSHTHLDTQVEDKAVPRETAINLIEGALPNIKDHLTNRQIFTLCTWIDSYLDKVFAPSSKLVEVMAEGWISIDDKDNPPPDAADFLVLFDNGDIRRYWEKHPKALYTHWMPLPTTIK